MEAYLNHETIDDILRRCCSEDDLRPALMQIHSEPPYVYATNGHILVRVLSSMTKCVYFPVEEYPHVEEHLAEWSRPEIKPSKLIRTSSIIDAVSKVGRHTEIIECEACGDIGVTIDYDDDGNQISSKRCLACDGQDALPGRVRLNSFSEQIKTGPGYFNPNYVQIMVDIAQLYGINSVNHFQECETGHNIFAVGDILIVLMPINNVRDSEFDSSFIVREVLVGEDVPECKNDESRIISSTSVSPNVFGKE